MPVAPLKPCAWPGCGALTAARHCERHAREYDRRRGSSTARGYDRAWQRVRALKLQLDPLCECDECRAAGRILPATVVDHVRSIEEAPHLRLDFANLRSMAKECHDARTARDQGIARGR